jgi:hypothetical protein
MAAYAATAAVTICAEVNSHLSAIRVVAAGDAMIAPGVTRRLIGEFAGQPRSGRSPKSLFNNSG